VAGHRGVADRADYPREDRVDLEGPGSTYRYQYRGEDLAMVVGCPNSGPDQDRCPGLDRHQDLALSCTFLDVLAKAETPTVVLAQAPFWATGELPISPDSQGSFTDSNTAVAQHEKERKHREAT